MEVIGGPMDAGGGGFACCMLNLINDYVPCH